MAGEGEDRSSVGAAGSVELGTHQTEDRMEKTPHANGSSVVNGVEAVE